MWSRIWRLLRDKGNRRVLTFFGSVLGVVGVLWTWTALFPITNYFRESASRAPAAEPAEQAAPQRVEQAALERERQRAEQAALERERQRAEQADEDRDSQRSPPTILETGYSLLKDIGG